MKEHPEWVNLFGNSQMVGCSVFVVSFGQNSFLPNSFLPKLFLAKTLSCKTAGPQDGHSTTTRLVLFPSFFPLSSLYFYLYIFIYLFLSFALLSLTHSNSLTHNSLPLADSVGKDAKIVEVLLESGADVNKQEELNLYFPLYWAACKCAYK